MDIDQFVKDKKAERTAKGLTVRTHFAADSKGVLRGVANVGFNTVSFANVESRDEFMARVQRNGGDAVIASVED